MPHTSRAKKNKEKGEKQHHQQHTISRNKRGEIEVEEGWTRIARSHLGLDLALWMPDGRASIVALTPESSDYDPQLDQGGTKYTYLVNPAPVPEGATLQKALAHYQKCETTWKQSPSWAALRDILELKVLPQDPQITNCICFGSSSPTGLLAPGVDRRNVAMYQVAAFKSIIEVLADKQGQAPNAFAQEPIYNTLDDELLSHLDIKVVKHPEAFNLTTATSFVFSLGAEQCVTRGALCRSPTMYMCTGNLETYIDSATGQIRSPQIGSIFVEEDDKGGDEVKEQEEVLKRGSSEAKTTASEERKQANPKQWSVEDRERLVKDAVQGAEILHRFKQGKDYIRLPEFTDHDYAFYNTWLFWKAPNVEQDDLSKKGLTWAACPSPAADLSKGE